MLRKSGILSVEFRSVALRGRGRGGAPASSTSATKTHDRKQHQQEQDRGQNHQSGGNYTPRKKYDPTQGFKGGRGGSNNQGERGGHHRQHSREHTPTTRSQSERHHERRQAATPPSVKAPQRMSEEDGALASLPLDQLMKELEKVGNQVHVERRGDMRDRLKAILDHTARQRVKHMTEDDLKRAYNFAFVTGSHKHALKLYFAKTELMSGVKDSGFSLHGPAVEAAYLVASLESLTKLAAVGAKEMMLHPLEIVSDVENCSILWRVACLAVEKEFNEKIRRNYGVSEEASEALTSVSPEEITSAARKVYEGIQSYNLWINGKDTNSTLAATGSDTTAPESTSAVAKNIKSPYSAQAMKTPLPGISLEFNEVWQQLKAFVRYSFQTDKGEMQCKRYFKEKRIIYNSELKMRAEGAPSVPTGDKRSYFYVTLIKSCNEGIWHEQAQEYFDEYTSIGEKEVSPKPVISYLSVLVKAREHKKVCELAGHLLRAGGSGGGAGGGAGDGMTLNPVLIANIGISASEIGDAELLKEAFDKLLTHPERRLVRPLLIHSMLRSMTKCPESGIEAAFERCLSENRLQEGVHYSSQLEFRAQINVATARHTSNPLPVVTEILKELDEKGEIYTSNLVLDLLEIFTRFESPLMIPLIQKYVAQQGGSVNNLDHKNRRRIFDYLAKWAYWRLDMLEDSERTWVIEWLTKNAGHGDRDVKDIVAKIECDLNREESPFFDPKLFFLLRAKTKTKVFVPATKEFPVFGISDEEIIRLKARPFESLLEEDKEEAAKSKAGAQKALGKTKPGLFDLPESWADGSTLVTQVPEDRFALYSPEEGSVVFLENYLLDVLRDSQLSGRNAKEDIKI